MSSRLDTGFEDLNHVRNAAQAAIALLRNNKTGGSPA
jgi:hypothetical protein